MGTERILFLLCFAVLVCGYTPTFRNEATHPLKAPTESTLGLQMNDESVGRTKSNIPKQETFFSGGKHFEYMLLNDSNVLLTSLQNDGPYDTAPEQSAPTKDDLPPKFDHPGTDEPILKPRALPIIQPNRTKVTNLPKNHSSPVQLNQRVSTPVRKTGSNINATDVNISSSTSTNMNFSKELPFNFRKIPDISSTTKLYSKHANSSEENFASFTSPLIGKPPSSENGEPVPPKESASSNSRRPNYDYDDSFTNLLISNGIWKFDNDSNKPEIQFSTLKSPVFGNENSNANPSVEDINRIMDSSIASIIRNNTDSKSAGSSRTKISKNVGATLEALTKSRIVLEPEISDAMPVNVSTDQEEMSNSTELIISKDPTPNALESSSRLEIGSVESKHDVFAVPTEHVEPSTSERFSLVFNTDESTKFTSTESNDNESSTYPAAEEMKISPNDSSATQLDKNVVSDNVLGLRFHNDGFTQLYETTERKSIPLASAGSAHTNVSNENPLAAKLYTDSSTIVDSSPLSVKRISPALSESNHESVEDTFSSSKRASVVSSSSPLKVEEQFLDHGAMPLTKFYSVNSPHEVKKKNYVSGKNSRKGKIVSLPEFISLTDTLVENLFHPVAEYFDNRFSSNRISKKLENKERKVAINRFGYVNIMNVLEMNAIRNKSERRESARIEGDPGLEGKIHNWIDLNDEKNTDPDPGIEYLFFEEESDARWFVLLLDGNSTAAQIKKKDFVKNLTKNLAVRLQLGYRDFKINTLIVIPPSLAVNVSIPTELPWINTKEELEIKDQAGQAGSHESARTNVLELLGRQYHVWPLLSLNPAGKALENAKRVDRKHDDVELYIFVLLGAICTFAILSLVFYGVYRLIQNHTMNVSFKVPVIFRDKYQYHKKLPECRSESLNVIFSENFDRKYTATSWLDNSHHSSSILKASSEMPPTIFVEKGDKFPEFGDTTTPVLNSPRLNKENKLNVLGCRPSCVLLPHSKTYLDSENNERCFDNPNYDPDAR